MDVIYARGMNCHLASVVSIAHFLGVHYPEAFATLWSETDFADEATYHIYVSKRVWANLKALGVKMEPLDCDALKRDGDLSRIPDGAMLLVGMDTFYTPWHPVSGHFHDRHYFFARKDTAHSFLCFDPVYNEKDKKIEPTGILSSIFELSRIYKTDASPPKHTAAQEAGVILRRHPETKEMLLAEILRCGGEGKRNLNRLIKQINAMINNRHLFRQYLQSAASASGHCGHLFDDAFLFRWEAVRNGLYKASILQDNENVIDAVSRLFAELMDQEIGMAKELLAMG